jgi:hypothetical protein
MEATFSPIRWYPHYGLKWLHFDPEDGGNIFSKTLVLKLRAEVTSSTVKMEALCRLSQYTAPILLCFSQHWAPSQHVHNGFPDDGSLKCRNMRQYIKHQYME